ncbi:unnamed protein product [Choristocarpus tenellus]
MFWGSFRVLLLAELCLVIRGGGHWSQAASVQVVYLACIFGGDWKSYSLIFPEHESCGDIRPLTVAVIAQRPFLGVAGLNIYMSAPSSKTLFVYGSLMQPEVLQVLLGRVPPTNKGILHGYHRYRIKEQVYPAIFPCEGSSVEGLLLPGLSPREQYILDLFEDEDYQKVDVDVRLCTSSESLAVTTRKEQTATAYVWYVEALVS